MCIPLGMAIHVLNDIDENLFEADWPYSDKDE